MRRFLRWTITGYRPFAFLPLTIMVAYWLGGTTLMVMVTSIIPAASVILFTIVEHRTPAAREQDAATGLGLVESAENWLETRLLMPEVPRSSVALMAVTIDDLDALEDRVGTALHESLMNDLAQRLQGLIRRDDLISRGRRADFLLCLADLKPPETENLLHLAQRLQATLEDPFEHGSVRVYCTMSIGIVRSGQLSAPTPLQMIRAAESANASAADAGPASIRLHQSSAGKLPDSDADLAASVAQALENGEIVAWYQPQVSTHSGEISGFEALARWEHPSRGLVSPATFLTIVERAGLSQRLAEVVLSHALSALRAWDRAGLNVPSVAVNFSSEELRNPRLSEYMTWEFDRHNVTPDRLGIEVLENVIAQSHDDIVARNLRMLANLGCRIDLDDFGTGYTSILNIRRFSVSRIKIDRSLISRVDVDRDQNDLVAALLAMSERLKVETLGEGVETQAEHAKLAQLGCDHVQGFSIARPMPLGDTITWVTDHRAQIAQTYPLPLPASSARDQG